MADTPRPGTPWLIGGVSTLFALALLWVLWPGASGLSGDVEALLARGNWQEADRLLTAAQANGRKEDAEFLKLRGDVRCAAGNPAGCADAYRRAIAGNPRFREDARLRTNVLALLHGDAGRDAAVEVAAGFGKSILREMDARTASKAYWTRWNAVRVLEAQKRSRRIDWVQVYGLDLLHGASCGTRRVAAERLARLGDDDALPYLEKARVRANGNLLERICIGATLDRSVASLKRE